MLVKLSEDSFPDYEIPLCTCSSVPCVGFTGYYHPAFPVIGHSAPAPMYPVHGFPVTMVQCLLR